MGPQPFRSVILTEYVFATKFVNMPVPLLIPPGLSVYIKPPDPPIALIVIVPSPAPLQEISENSSLVIIIETGSVIVMLLLVTGPQPLASFTLTV